MPRCGIIVLTRSTSPMAVRLRASKRATVKIGVLAAEMATLFCRLLSIPSMDRSITSAVAAHKNSVIQKRG